MPRVLFVDDDDLVLTALGRRMKRPQTGWDMVFVSSGAAALEEIERKPFDVVVSDMRMPGMSGAELFAAIMQRYPGTGRIGLTGYFDEVDLVGRGIAHAMLNKPCDNTELRSTIQGLLPVQSSES